MNKSKRMHDEIEQFSYDILKKQYIKNEETINEIKNDQNKLRTMISDVNKKREQYLKKIQELEELKNVYCKHVWDRDSIDSGPYEHTRFMCKLCDYRR